jgi:exoribonuclease II
MTLSTTGEIWLHKREDVSFTVPNFISQDLAARCDDKDPFREEIQHAARVQAIKAIREFELSLESVYNDIGVRLRGIYARVRSKNPNLWTRTTVAEIMELLSLPSSSIKSPVLASFAIHKHLMARNNEFVAVFEKGTGTFDVRPETQAKAIGIVTEMNRTNDPALKSFIEKAKRIFALSRPAAKESLSELPSAQKITDKSLSFNYQDRIIIQFLIDSLRLRRRAQDDPYASVASTILKKLGLQVDFFDDTGVRQVLSELGILAPWQDLHSLFAVETEFESTPLTGMHPLPRAYEDALDGDGLYKHDIMDPMRHDFGDLPVYIIDDAMAEELDDGVSVERIPSEPENVWIHVHVADPSAILPPHHPLAVKARQQGTTRYWIDHSLPMLPKRIAMDGSMGREQGLPERVMTFSCKVDAKANIIDYKVRPAIVRNTHKLQYDTTDAAMGKWQPICWYPFGGAPPAPSPAKLSQSTLDDLRLIDSIAERIVRHRLTLPTFMYAEPVAHPVIQNTPVPLPASNTQAQIPMLYRGFPSLLFKVDYFPLVEHGSRRIVAECMKLAGRVASRFCRDRGIPMLRRMGGPMMAPSEEVFADLLASKDDQGYVSTKKCLNANLFPSKSEYTLDLAPHWTMGIPEGEGYIRVTSPLRRYLDLVVHWQIKHAMLHPTARPLFSPEVLMDLGRQTEMQEKDARNEDRKHHQTWALFYLQRWVEMQSKKQLSAEDDPLRNLVAQVMHPPVFNAIANSKDCKVYISHLGLPALLSDAAGRKDTLEPGDILTNIEVESIRLGQPAQLMLRYRR